MGIGNEFGVLEGFRLGIRRFKVKFVLVLRISWKFIEFFFIFFLM